MIRTSKAFSGFSVDNLMKAKDFYSGMLGLTVKEGPMGNLELHLDGNNPVMIYAKPGHEPAGFTVLNFPVSDLEKVIDELSTKGISFEQYGGEIKTDEKGIHRKGDFAIAWFKDPAGNILSLIEEPKG